MPPMNNVTGVTPKPEKTRKEHETVKNNVNLLIKAQRKKRIEKRDLKGNFREKPYFILIHCWKKFITFKKSLTFKTTQHE